MPKVFSRRTLGQFEDASASIPLRYIDRAFAGAEIRLGEDSGGAVGSRRTQFRRYVAGADQHDPQQLGRLGAALGALIAEAATSKQEFLVRAAERDGFCFADGVFRPAESAPSSFALTRVEDLPLIEDRGRRLQLLANDSPNDAIAGAKELVESVCRTVLRLIGEPSPGKTELFDFAQSTLEALERVPAGLDDAKKTAAMGLRCAERLGAVVASFDGLRTGSGSDDAREGERDALLPRHARLAVGAAVTLAGFVAETYCDGAARKTG